MRKSLLFCPVVLLLCCPLLAQALALEDANVRVEIGAKGELVSLLCTLRRAVDNSRRCA